MKANKQTIAQVQEMLDEIAKHYSSGQEEVMTDINFHVNQESGEVSVIDDNDEEIYTCTIDEWIDCSDENFFQRVKEVLRWTLNNKRDEWKELSIMKPFSFHLIDMVEELEAELYVVDDDTILIESDQLMEGLDKDLDEFLHKLLEE